VPWREVFRALGCLSSNPRLILEVIDKERVRAGADHLIALGLAV
jgi:hypothetical protein